MPARYRVEITPAALRDLKRIPPSALTRIDARIRGLASDPRPAGAKKLEGGESLFRIRVGDYRVVYQIDDDVLLVLVVRIGHRREVYRSR